MKKKIAIRAAMILAAWFVLHVLIVTYDGLHDTAVKSDCILVLGNRVNADGSPSPRLKARLDCALELYRRGLAPVVIVSGGPGPAGFNEATVMRNYLVDSGVAGSNVIADDAGVNTRASAIHYKAIAAERKFNSVIIVSQFYHITRTRMLLKHQGATHITSAHADYFSPRDFYSLAREFVAYYWELY